VQEDERALVGDAEITGRRQRGLALHLMGEDRNGSEIATERKLGAGEQRSGRD